MINLDKSQLLCSRNGSDIKVNELVHLLGFKAVESYDKYLGLPTIVGKSKNQVFNFVKEPVWKKLKGWKENVLSRVGREVLMKLVAQAIPSYIMSCYALSKGIRTQTESMISGFFWSGNVERWSMHWVKW